MSKYYAKIIPVLLLCLERIRPLTASPSSAGPFGADTIANFLRNRCGPTEANESPALWLYEGTLTDPMTGKVVAEVEGLELVKPLPMIEPSQLSDDYDQLMLLNNLSAKDLLCPQQTNPTSCIPPWDSATTILSRRLFCYRRPSSNSKNDDPNGTSHSNTETKQFSPYKSLLTSLRLRPDGPLRHVSPLENIAIYDSAITYISRNKGREMVIFSEHGGRGGIAENEDINDRDSVKNYIMGSAQTDTSASRKGQSSSVFDFAVRAQRGTLNSKSESGGPMLPPLKIFSSNQIGSDEVIISPPRSQMLQFGKGDGNGSSSDRKYGSVRETYSYSFDHNMEGGDGLPRSSEASRNKLNFFGRMKEQIGRKTTIEEERQPQTQCSVRYTRYGEAPPWYAPGRSCTLELRGKRIALPSSITLPGGNEGAVNHLELSQHLPPLPSWAAFKCNFWSGWPTIFSSHDRTTESTDLMRQYYQLPPRSEKELAGQAVELFCNEKRLSIGPLDDYPAADRKQWLSSTENALSKMQTCIRRISKSFIVSE